jgi:hypothetical protein
VHVEHGENDPEISKIEVPGLGKILNTDHRREGPPTTAESY